ncbi:hypothetical protein OOK60_16040 [Trichothermofontia sichuanensis B231]|nr:hypothetical protein [Trichothermofontia sichuanensis]UZQ53983.1 hypothetical protein OOK60_16040 [Trichothermofontia sichuanensis B231]
MVNWIARLGRRVALLSPIRLANVGIPREFLSLTGDRRRDRPFPLPVIP